MKKSEKGISLLVIVILLLALTVVSIFGYYVYLRLFKNPVGKTNTAQVTTPSVIPVPTPVAKASIIQANHTQGGFSFKAPITASVMQPDATGFRIIYIGPKTSKENGSVFSDGYIITIAKLGATGTINIQTTAQTSHGDR
jgi:predicted permease